MTPISTTAAGTCVAFADVCNVPSPAGPVPTPFVNVAQCVDAHGGTTSRAVKIGGRAVITVRTEIARSSGDEAGVGGGVISGTFLGSMRYRSGSSKVLVEGSGVVTHLAPTAHNGTNANAPCGLQVSPSQSKVFAR